MISIIAGCTMLCESLRSEHADPIARKIDPNISAAQIMKTRNQPMSDGIDEIGPAERDQRVDAADEVDERQQQRDRDDAEQLAGQQLERRHRPEQDLADLAHLLFDDRVEQMHGAGHHAHEHQHQQEHRARRCA